MNVMKITRNGEVLYDSVQKKQSNKARNSKGQFVKAWKRFVPLSMFCTAIAIVILFGEYTVTRFKVFDIPTAQASVRELSKEELVTKYEKILKEQQDQIDIILEDVRLDKMSFQ